MNLKTRSNTAAAILSNTVDLENAYVDALDAEGSAYAENEKYLNSIQGKLDQFTNAVQTMWSNTLDDGLIKGFVALGTELIKLIDNLGLIKALVMAIGTYNINKYFGKSSFGDSVKNNSVIDTALSKHLVDLRKEASGLQSDLANAQEKLNNILSQGETGEFREEFDNVSQKVDDLNAKIKKNGEEINKTEIELQNYQQTTQQTGITASGVWGKITSGAKAAGKAIASVAKSMLTMVAITTALELLAKGVEWIVSSLDDTSESAEEAQEKLDELTSELSGCESELKSLESELKNTNEKIEELMSQGTLSFTEQEELERLQSISAELERQITLKQTLQGSLQKGANAAAVNATNKHLDTSFYSEKSKSERQKEAEETGETIGQAAGFAAGAALFAGAGAIGAKIGGTVGSLLGPLGTAAGLMIGAGIGTLIGGFVGKATASKNAGNEYDSEETVDEALANMEEARAKLIKSRDEALKAYTEDPSDKDAAEKYQEAEEALNNYDATMAKHISQIQVNYNAMDWDTASESQKEFMREQVDLLDKYNITMGGENAKSNAIARIFGDEASADLKKIKKEIEDTVESGENVNLKDIFGDDKSYSSFVERLEEMGLNVQDVINYFNDLKIAKDEAIDDSSITDSITEISALESAFNSLGDAVKEFKEDGTASVSTLKSLSELFSDVDGFEELYKVLATGEGNIEEAVTNVANAYIAQKNLLSDLTDEELQIMVARLESLGVINAQEILLHRQTLQQELDEKLQGYNIDLSAYSTVEQAKEAIANAATINICSAVADMETELREKYGVNLSDFVSTEEAKVAAAKKAAKEIAKANKETALSNLSKDTELTDREYLDQQAKIESDYRNTISSIDSISTNVGKVVDSVASTLDSYYNKTFKFDFSGNKIGIGRDYADEITDKNSKDSKSALEKLKKKYENQISLLENQKTYIENEISRLEAEDKQVSRNLYEEQIKLEQQKLALYEKEREELLAQMSTVAKNSDSWYEYAEAIWECEHAIQETTISIVELQKQIAQLYIDVFNKIEEAYSREQSLHDKRIQYLEDEIELLKLRNEYATISPETYNQLNAEEDAKIQSSKNEVERLKALLQKGIDENGQILTEEQIYDMLETIYEKEADIRQSEITKAQNEQNKKQAYLDRFNNTSEAYDNLGNVYQGNYDNAEYYKKYADLYGISIPKEILDYQTSQLEQQVQVTLNKKAELERQLAEAIASGDIQVGDSQWLEMVNAINDCTSAANEFQYQMAEVAQEINALSVEKFNDIKDAFSNVNDVFNDRQSYIEEYMNYLEALGITVPAEMYEELIANEKQRQASNMASIERLRNQLAEMEANGYTAEDDEWVQAQADIRALEKEVLASETAMAQWNKTIQEMSFEKFDEFLKRIQDVCDELENVYGLISDEDVALEDGSWTEEGIMSLGLMTQKMAIAKEQAAEYAKEIEKLNEEYKNGNMSEQDYYNRLMELKNGQWESINAYKDAKDAIIDINEARIDMIEQGIQKEIDAYTELIDLKKKELDAERDLYNFRKDIKSQTKDIATLERKIAAMSGSTDAATIAQRSKLEAQLREARESLSDTFYSHAIDSQNAAYDDELDSYTKSKEDYVEQLREALENVEQVVADSMAQVLINADSILTGLNDVSSEYGITLSDYLMLPWQNAATQATAYKESGILDLADFTEQTGIYSGMITEQINELFGNGSLAAGLFQTSVEGVVESIKVTVNEATSPLTSNLQLPWETVKDYAQNTFAPEVMYALQSVADDASGKKEQLTNDLITAFQEGVNNAEEFNQAVIDALNDVISKSDEFADVVPSNVTAPSDDPWNLWSNNIQSLIQDIINKANSAVDAINEMNAAASNAQSAANVINNTSGRGNSGSSGKTTTSQSKSTQKSTTKKKEEAKKKTKYYKYLKVNGDYYYECGSDASGKNYSGHYLKRSTKIPYTAKLMASANEVLYYKAGSKMLAFSAFKHPVVYAKSGYVEEYAKGTLGTKQDQWAITDEPQYGDELVLIPNKNGNLSYMRKGTSVVPADLTKKIIDIAQSQTSELGNNLIKVSIPSVDVNNNIELTFDTLLRVENATQETIPELKKLVQEQLDIFSRKLNYGIKRVGGIK